MDKVQTGNTQAPACFGPRATLTHRHRFAWPAVHTRPLATCGLRLCDGLERVGTTYPEEWSGLWPTSLQLLFSIMSSPASQTMGFHPQGLHERQGSQENSGPLWPQPALPVLLLFLSSVTLPLSWARALGPGSAHTDPKKGQSFHFLCILFSPLTLEAHVEWGGVKRGLEVVTLPLHGPSDRWPEQSLYKA